MMTAREIIRHMESLRDERQRQQLTRFFKTGPGEYGEGDEFLGLKVPQTRQLVKTLARDLPVEQVPELLMSRWHEVRLFGLLVLVERFGKLATKRLENDRQAIAKRDEIVKMYGAGREPTDRDYLKNRRRLEKEETHGKDDDTCATPDAG
jgi:hypothetical protein